MPVKIAFFGQAPFAKDILVRLLDAGHEIVGVYTPPEGRCPDPLAEEAAGHGLRLLRHRYFRRRGGEAIESRVKEHAELGAELNVLAYVTAIIPPEIVDAPVHRSLCFHPSLLPRFRGGNAIPWQIILGEPETGVTVFQPDAGVDTGPIAVQKGGVVIQPSDTAATLYYRELYPLGVEAVCEAVERIDRGSAELRPQDESRATFQGLVDDEVARIDWARPAGELDRLIRGCDPQPGAHTTWHGDGVRLFDARLDAGASGAAPGTVIEVGEDGVRLAARGGILRVGRLRMGDAGKVAAAETPLRPGDVLG
jgi:methionyl-tRNA formyltransferase